jgi:N-sulfoglucosamine sulfohydrolase
MPEKQGFHGRSFLPVLGEERPRGWDEVYASHTFHEVTMYYPMRVVRTRQHKLIWNVAAPLPFPFASDLWEAATWQDTYRRGKDALYGQRTVRAYLQRPSFELYDLEADPHEVKNLAGDPRHAKLLAGLKDRLRAFQKATQDPWLSKWEYE